MNKIILSTLFSLALVACSNEEPKNVEIRTVTDFEYTMNNLPAVSIYFGESKDNFCDITLNRQDISEENKVISSVQSNNKSISASCSWDKEQFVQSSKHPTNVSATLSKINPTNKTATLEVSLKLVSLKTLDTYFTLDKTQLTIKDQMFDNLIN